jgi:hypothetical protein
VSASAQREQHLGRTHGRLSGWSTASCSPHELHKLYRS